MCICEILQPIRTPVSKIYFMQFGFSIYHRSVEKRQYSVVKPFSVELLPSYHSDIELCKQVIFKSVKRFVNLFVMLYIDTSLYALIFCVEVFRVNINRNRSFKIE